MYSEVTATTNVMHWCHGMTGYIWAVSQLKGYEKYQPIIKLFFESICNIDEFLDPTMCHGSAGVLESLRLLKNIEGLDEKKVIYQIDKYFQMLASTRQQYKCKEVWSSEDPTKFTPDFWVGHLGSLISFLMTKKGMNEAVISAKWLTTCLK